MKKTTLLKRIVLICLVLLFVMPITGCKKQPSKADQAVAYMNAKYDDEFTFKYYPVGDSRSYAFLSSKKFPDANVQVAGEKRDDGTYKFWDNYVYFKYEEETKTFYKDFFEEVFQCEIEVEYRLQYSSGTNLRKDFTDEMTFNEFIHNHDVSFYKVLVLDEKYRYKDKSEIENLVKSAIVDNNLILSANIYIDGHGTLDIAMIEHEEFVIFEWE